MNSFLEAQIVNPFDPTPMLIQADWLEEQGDEISASVLRGLASCGINSIAILSLADFSAFPLRGTFGFSETNGGCGFRDNFETTVRIDGSFQDPPEESRIFGEGRGNGEDIMGCSQGEVMRSVQGRGVEDGFFLIETVPDPDTPDEDGVQYQIMRIVTSGDGRKDSDCYVATTAFLRNSGFGD